MAVLTSYDTAGLQWGALGDLGGTDYNIAMGFTTTAIWTITSISIVARGGTGGRSTPADNITLRLETDNAGIPSGTLADANATGSITAFVGAAYAERTCTFATSFVVADATAFHITTSVPAQANNTCYEWEGIQPEGYAGGSGHYKPAGGAWTAWGVDPNGYDMSFYVYGTVGGGGEVAGNIPTLLMMGVG